MQTGGGQRKAKKQPVKGMGITTSKRKAEEDIKSSPPPEKKARSEDNSAKPLEKNPELEKAKEDSRRELIGRFSEALETEFGCVICLEVFIQPTSLDCGHTFCTNCITDWKKLNYSCPTCRATDQLTLRKRNEIKNMINKVYGIFGGAELAERTKLLKERKEMEKKKAAAAVMLRIQDGTGPRARVSLTRARVELQLEQPVAEVYDAVRNWGEVDQNQGQVVGQLINQEIIRIIVAPQAVPPRRYPQRQAAINANAQIQSGRRGGRRI